MGLSVDPVFVFMGQEMLWEVRFGGEHHRYGDPFTGSCNASRIGHIALITALSGAPRRLAREAGPDTKAGPVITFAEVRQLRRIMRAKGMTHTSWKRERATGASHKVALPMRGDDGG